MMLFDFLKKHFFGQTSASTLRAKPATPFRARLVGAAIRNPIACLGQEQKHKANRFSPHNVGIVGFHDFGFPIAKLAEPYAAWVFERSQQLHTKVRGRSTNLTDGLRKSIALMDGRAPKTALSIFALSDGLINAETDNLWQVVTDAQRRRIKIYTVGFGPVADNKLLRRIAEVTGGWFTSPQSLHELSATLVATGRDTAKRSRGGQSAMVLCIDCSGSMTGPCDGTTKIQAVERSILDLMNWYQRDPH